MCFFTPELLGKPSRRIELEAHLRQALAQQEFVLQYQDLVDVLASTLERTGLAPALLEVEINEAMALKDAARAEVVTRALSKLGVRVVLDDFGAGPSNFLALRRLPIKSLKIDRSLVRHCATDTDYQADIKAIMASAKALDLDVGAKGVETHEQLDQLRKLCCDQVQGYFLGRPRAP